MSFENSHWYSRSWAVEIMRIWNIHWQDVRQYSYKQIYSKKKQWYWTLKATRESESFSWQQYLQETWNQLSSNQVNNYTKARLWWRALVLASSSSPSGYSGSSCRWTESCRSRPLGKMWYTCACHVDSETNCLFIYWDLRNTSPNGLLTVWWRRPTTK